MTSTRALKSFVASALMLAALVPAADAGQARGGRQGRVLPAPAEGGVTPAEIQRMFDAYALMQAQEQLQIADDQFTRFLTRFKALQELRRSALGERTRAVADLRRLIAQQADESQLRERLTALQELDARSAADLKKAYEAIDQVLDVRQQAKFRVFEELMERRKLELVTRARQANRPKQ
jgi:hypothetical protein